MVSLDQLAALDLLLWLTASQRAARLEGTNQSTIIRRSRVAEECFGVAIARGEEGWNLRGDTRLLAMERRLHQEARLLGARPLRLQVPYWSLRGPLRRPPSGWCLNPPSATGACENPVELLRDRVIDACLLTPTQIPEYREDLMLVDLLHRPIELTVFHRGDVDKPQQAWRQLQAEGELVLRQLPFLPRTCLQRSQEWFAALQAPGSGAAAAPEPGVPNRTPAQAVAQPEQDPPLSVAFLTPEMRSAQGLPFAVDSEIEPYAYVERLVVLAENAQHTAMRRLREHLEARCGCAPALAA